MEVNYIDMIISIIQSIFFVCILNYCLKNEETLNYKKSVVCVILLSCIGYFVTDMLGNISICVFITHILGMLIITYLYKHKYNYALVSYNFIYCILTFWIILFGNIICSLLKQIVAKEYTEIVEFIFIYISQVVFFIVCILNANKIKQIYKILLAEKFSKTYIIMISFVPDFVISFFIFSFGDEQSGIAYIIITMLLMFLIFSVIYFIKIKERANRLFKLNETLENKNSELKKIKCDYGIQMSSLYELCLREKYEDVATLLKSIINSPNDSSAVEKNRTKESLLSLATKHVICDEVNIIIEDNANFQLISMSEMELFRIIVNIVNNAIKAMKNRGTLIAKSFDKDDSMIVEIENDGEKIPEKYMDKIFESGFTTKSDNDKNHGYGLSIVKELIESHDGNIFVESNELRTKFTIVLPIRKSKNVVGVS